MGTVPQWFYIIIVTIVYFGYIFLGGLVFMWLEKPREEMICAEIKTQMQRVRNLNAEAERLKDSSTQYLNDIEEIDTECAAGDTSEACVQVRKRDIRQQSRRSAIGNSQKQFRYFAEPKSFWEARDVCRTHNMALTNGMVHLISKIVVRHSIR